MRPAGETRQSATDHPQRISPGSLCRGVTGLDVSRWFLALNLVWVGYDFTVLSGWFGGWTDGLTPTTDTLSEQLLLPRRVLELLPTFWNLPGWLAPILLVASALIGIAAGVRRSRVEAPALWVAAFLLLAIIVRNPRLYSQADWWLFYCLVWANLARKQPSPWAAVWRLQCVCVYFFAGVAKLLEPAWRSGEAVQQTFYTPFAAFPWAQSLADLPAWIYFGFAVLTIGQRLGVSVLLLLPDGKHRLAGWLRRAAALSFGFMHLGYMALLDVGTFSTVGLACVPGLWEDPRKQIGEWRSNRQALTRWLPAAATAGLVFFAAPLHLVPRPGWISEDAFERMLTIAPRWDMFAHVAPHPVAISSRVWYGAGDTVWYDPMLAFLGQNPREELSANPFRWNALLWNWRLRLWILNLTAADPSAVAVNRFREVMLMQIAPPQLASMPRTRGEVRFVAADEGQLVVVPDER